MRHASGFAADPNFAWMRQRLSAPRKTHGPSARWFSRYSPFSRTKNGTPFSSASSCQPCDSMRARSSAVTGMWYDRQHDEHPLQSQF